MERLLQLRDIQERYGVSRQTARKYMLLMAHMENPLRVTEAALRNWEQERTKYPGVNQSENQDQA